MSRNAMIVIIALVLIILALILFPRVTTQNTTSPTPSVTGTQGEIPTDIPQPTEDITPTPGDEEDETTPTTTAPPTAVPN